MFGSRTIGLVTAMIACSTAIAAAETKPRLISVSGTAEVSVTPDQVVLTIGIETLDKDINKAQQQNSERVAEVFRVTEKVGLQRKNVCTDHVSISPEYKSYNGLTEFLGYEVDQTIAITLDDVTKYETLLTGLLTAGVNRVHDVSFRTTELRKHKDDARLKAAQAAREKAIALAGALGEEIGRPHSITENSPRTRSSSSWWSQRSSWVLSNGASVPLGADSDSVEAVAPGKITIVVSVDVSFELK